ncbi:MAG: UDP-glucose/GDP-mannose dehydrogenase family protein [Candidatus Woesearchaeota archaeon]
MAKISVVGSGYVGLVTAAAFSALGHEVVCADIDREKVAMINKGIAPIREEHLDEILKKLVPERLRATSDVKEAVLSSSVTFICVNTPIRKNGTISLKNIFESASQIGKALAEKKGKHLIIIKSTVPPGTSEMIVKTLEKESKKSFGKDFGVVMNPEFLREGKAMLDFFKPSRIVIGSSDPNSRRAARKLYSWTECPVIECSFRDAEMAKYASNAFLAAKISFINEIGNICKKSGADTNTVARIMGLDPRIGPSFLSPGIGFGGSCLPKDLKTIIRHAEKNGVSPKLLSSVLEVNNTQIKMLLKILKGERLLKGGVKLGVLGLTFKAGTDDIRESPALRVINALLKKGIIVKAYDPLGIENVRRLLKSKSVTFARNSEEVIKNSDAILILTEWEEFRKLNFGTKRVIDCKNLFGASSNRPKHYIGLSW